MSNIYDNAGVFSKKLASRLKEIRIRKNMKLCKLAPYIGVTASVISRAELGCFNINIEYLPRYSEAFDISIPDLLDFDKKVSDLINPVRSSRNIT